MAGDPAGGPLDPATGLVAPCLAATVYVQVRDADAQVAVAYEFAPSTAAEFTLPLTDLPSLTDLTVAVGGTLATGVQVEVVSVDGTVNRRPVQLDQLHAPPPGTRCQRLVFPLPPCDTSAPLRLDVAYRHRLEQAGPRLTLLLPLALLPTPPQSITMDVQLSESIRRISCVNRPCECCARIEGGAAAVVILQPEALDLADRTFVVVIELGSPEVRTHRDRVLLALLLLGSVAVSYAILAADLP